MAIPLATHPRWVVAMPDGNHVLVVVRRGDVSILNEFHRQATARRRERSGSES